MRLRFLPALLLSMSILFSACGGRTDKTVISVDSLLADEHLDNGIISLSPYTTSDTVKWRSQICTYTILRTVDNTLPIVTDAETGQKFAANRIGLIVTCGADTIVNRSFTKNDFEHFLDEGLLRDGRLEGMVFDQIDNDDLCFATSVSYPSSDFYMPLRLRFTPDGTLTIEKDNYFEDSMFEEEP